MNSYKKGTNLVGWLVFAITAAVFFMSVERTGSLWDCGEFVAGCYKLQVVHPPGAPLFLMIGKLATVIGQMFSNDPSVIAFSVNLMSGLCTALTATFVCWTTMILGKIALNGRENEPSQSEFIALSGAGLVAGLCTAFASSIWFSAVEGEVYAMSTMFTALTLWAMIKWYNQPDTHEADRWMLVSIYAAALSIGVHLLSLLTFPALALFYYFKKTAKPTFKGMVIAGIIGVLSITVIQTLIITGIPALWGMLEVFCVNTLGLPFTIPSLILTLGIVGGLSYWGLRLSHRRSNATLQNIFLGLSLSVIGFSTIGMVLLRANANPPINMNNPSDPIRVIPYLNREQYGERPLLFGPQFNAKPSGQETADRYGRVGDKYEIVDRKVDYTFDPTDKVFFPRMGHYESDRSPYYKIWMDIPQQQEIGADRPNTWDNWSFFFRYQVGWMYVRYFMWNFAGRQNFEQGFGPWDESKGNWESGIGFLDKWRLFDYTDAPDWLKNDASRNHYFLLPLLFGLFGLVWHYGKRRYDMFGLLALFIITGIGIIVYTNEPPNEPRERDYVIVGSIFTFAIWIGMGVLALYDLLRDFKLSSSVAAPVASLVVLIAPFLMGTQNFDDHSRAKHKGARDYATNFLESVDKNAIIFTYGDNDTYPLWYAQEVEGIRRDVRVVNLSLIAVDWYIDGLRRKVNESPAIKMSVPQAAIRGFKRNQLPINTKSETVMSINDLMKYLGEDHPIPTQGYTFESQAPTNKIVIPINKQLAVQNGIVSAQDSVLEQVPFTLPGNYIIKDDLAVLDIIANNASERPIYWAVTCRPEKMEGLDEYMQLEGLATRFIPVRSQSDRSFGIIGSGRVATDKVFDRVMNKFHWGNFDKEKTFISKNYQPSVQTTQFVILRTALEMIRKGDKDKATQLIDKMFEAFPNMNFPYNAQTMYYLDAYTQAGHYEKAKKHIAILADNLAANLKFYNSVSQEDRMGTFAQDYQSDMQTKDQLIALVTRAGDNALKDELEKKFGAYKLQPGLK
ncbi:MAG: DUF2723 domain-containing protein [Saprospiraceae bacterium]|nr:DUF2723 domain-containing protein [Saprospiraceae bacterium]